MNAQQKTQLEQRAVIGLALVFLAALLFGPARKMLFPQQAKLPAPQLPATPVPGSLPTLMKQYQDRLDPLMDEPEPVRLAASAAQIGYSAQYLRDPFLSLLPQESAAQIAERVAGAAASPYPAPPQRPTPPPVIKLQGVIWGGPAPKAIVEGQLCGIGDVIKGAKIVGIDRQGITIEHEGQPVAYMIPDIAEGGQRPRMR